MAEGVRIAAGSRAAGAAVYTFWKSALIPTEFSQTRASQYSRNFGYKLSSRLNLESPAACCVSTQNLCDGARQLSTLLREHFADALDLCAQPTELFFDSLITAVDVIDAIDDGFPVSDQRGQYQ